MNISICIATHRRPAKLAALLQDLCEQELTPTEVIVVDNDANGSARAVVDRRLESGTPYLLRYDLQPIKNISLTRNRTVQLAGGEWLAFVDDDERAPSAWLKRLVAAAEEFHADAVLGPVEPVVPPQAPSWIRRGTFYHWPRLRTGAVIPPNRLRFGNVLLHSSLLQGMSMPFDIHYGATGGEDGDLLARLVQQGAHIVWCDEAIVSEPVEASRLSLRWLLLRALRGGQDFARHTLAGRYGPATPLRQMRFFMRALTQSIVASALAMVSWPAGKHHAARWLIKASANLGKMSVFCGCHYAEYGAQPQ